MPSPAKIAMLPEDIRKDLDQRLVGSGFSGYYALEAWLGDQGYEIGKSAIHRYGQGLKRSLAAIKSSTEAAKAIVEAMDDQANTISEGLMNSVQANLFEIMMKLREMEDLPFQQQVKMTGDIARAASDLARASVNQKKHAAAVKAKLDALLADAQRGDNSLDIQTLQRIRREVYGLAE